MKISEALNLKEGDQILVVTSSEEIATKYEKEIHSCFSDKHSTKHYRIKAVFKTLTTHHNVSCTIAGEQKSIYINECSL